MALGVKIFHIGAFGFYVCTFHALLSSIDKTSSSSDINVQTMGRFTTRFLTNWTYAVQLAYFGLCVLGHFLNIFPKLNKTRDKVNSFGTALLTTVAGPMAFVVTFTFWLIYMVDRELIYPKWIDQVIPLWVNHALHTVNSIFPILDICLVHHKFPSFLFASKAITGYLLLYGVVFYGTYFQTGIWIYPFLNELSWPQRGVMSLVNLLLALASFSILLLINKLRWGFKDQPSAKQTKSKKSAKQRTKKAA